MGLLLFWNGTPNTERFNRRAMGGGGYSNLSACRYNVARDEFLECFPRVQNVGIDWLLPGGLQKATLTIAGKNKYDVAERKRLHLGHGFAILDKWLDIPVADGWCYEIVPDGRHVHYIIGGAWRRHNDQYETDDPASVDSDAWLKTVLTNHVPAVSSDHFHIDATGTDVTGYTVNASTGDRPQSIVEKILEMGSSSNVTWDYWLRPALMRGAFPQLPIPYLKPRTSLTVSRKLKRRDLRDGQMSAHIWDLKNDIDVSYGVGLGSGTVSVSDADSIANYWQVKNKESFTDLDSTQATQYANNTLERDKDGVFQNSFVVGSANVANERGALYPLHRMIINPQKVQVTDFFPSGDYLNGDLDRFSTFRVTGMGYDHVSRTMRITPDLRDDRLDVRLADAGILGGTVIFRG